MPGVVSPDLPSAFAHSAAYGDIIAAILALLALYRCPVHPALSLDGSSVSGVQPISSMLSMFADRFVFSQLNDKQLARSPKDLGGLSYTYPDRLSDETIEIYFRPLIESPLRKFQLDQCVIGLGTNVLIPIRQDLRRWHGPTRMVWGLKDTFFPPRAAQWRRAKVGLRSAVEGLLYTATTPPSTGKSIPVM